MALKFGRTSGITSRKDPQGNVRYTEEELDAYNTAVAAEVKRKSDYDAGMAQFKKDEATYYGKNTVDTKAAEAATSMLNQSNMKIGGAKVTGTAAKGISQAQHDLDLQAKVNKGMYVSINDPSISDKTRELMQGANIGTDMSNAYVRTGTDAKDYSQMYGYNYNPVQRKKDALAGKLSSSELDQAHVVKDEYGIITMGKKPIKPAAYVPVNLGKEIKANDVDWKPSKMEPLKPTKVDQKKYGKLRPAKEAEVPTWSAPVMDRRKGAKSVGQTRIKPTGESGVENASRKTISDKILPQRIKYNTEKRQSAAYYGNETVTGEKITGKNASQLESLKQEVKGDVKRMKGEGRLKDARDVRGDLPQIRKAIRYAKKADLGVSSVTGLTMEGDQSTLRYFTPERTKLAMNGDGKMNREDGAMAGYKDVQRYNNNKAMEQTFKSQADNPANKNNMLKKLADVATAAAANASPTSFYTTRGQMKDKFKTDNPTATPSQIRQGVRAENKANTKLIKEVQKKTGL
jgi:hypothetical protein